MHVGIERRRGREGGRVGETSPKTKGYLWNMFQWHTHKKTREQEKLFLDTCTIPSFSLQFELCFRMGVGTID